MRGLVTSLLLGVVICTSSALAQAPSTPSAPVPPNTAGLGVQPSGSAATVFRKFSSGVVKIQVTSNGTNAKAEVGSGIFIDTMGSVITNYHVISKLVVEPDRYHADLTDISGKTLRVTVVAIDVVHDLALLHSAAHPPLWLSLENTPIDQGDRLYSLGFPLDLGLTIVEGTYNGLLENTLYPKIHFSGSINPGMSGGPALAADGHVVGINVQTSGNGIGFLVPVARARELVARATQPGYSTKGGFLKDAARQILQYQDLYLRGMFTPGSPTVTLGSYLVPTKPGPSFKCWADMQRDDKRKYDITTYQCTTGDGDELFISDAQQSGVAMVMHQLVRGLTLNRLQFSTLYADQLARKDGFQGDEESVTKFSCATHNVGHDGTKLRTIFCIRAYKKLPGLYDAIVRVAALGSANTGIISTLQLNGVSFANAQTLAGRYVRSVTWKK